MRAASAQAAAADGDGLEEPRFRTILLRGLPQLATDGAVPLAAFYVAWRLGGLAPAVGAATVASAAVWAWARHRGRDALLVRLSLAFALVQGAVGLVARSELVYLAQPVLANAVWALAFVGSAVVGRPLAGAFARAWYPFTEEILATRAFRRVYGFESVVWGLYMLGRSGLRLGELLAGGGVGGFVVVSVATGTPAMVALLAWSVWYAVRRLPVELERELVAS